LGSAWGPEPGSRGVHSGRSGPAFGGWVHRRSRDRGRGNCDDPAPSPARFRRRRALGRRRHGRAAGCLVPRPGTTRKADSADGRQGAAGALLSMEWEELAGSRPPPCVAAVAIWVAAPAEAGAALVALAASGSGASDGSCVSTRPARS
jgi:hypothetical protein